MELTISEALQSKWKPVLEHNELPDISDPYRKAVTTILLENQQQYLREDGPSNISNNLSGDSTANVARWDPILISLVRRAMPNLIAYDVCGVQPMSGPTGLIFALRSRYNDQFGNEALFQEANTNFAGNPATGLTGRGYGATAGMIGGTAVNGIQTDPFALTDALNASATGAAFGLNNGSVDPFIGTAMATNSGEALGYPNGSQAAGNQFAQMAFSIEKTTVTAQTRALKAEYTMELAQDLKAIHGLDAETELANILSSEILAEINREVVRRIYVSAKLGARSGTTQTAGVFDLNVDSNGRWSVEKFKGLLFQIERECNQIAKETRRGKGNFVLCSADVASALAMAGVLDYAPALSTNLNVDDTGNTFAGVLNGKLRVYIDPYASQTASHEFFCVGYKGSSPYDAGLFYCPYVPLQMVRAVGENSFQPKIGFKTRYGMIHNPFVLTSAGAVTNNLEDTVRRNMYYRIVKVTNLF
jgi:hypothetical protein